MSYRRRSLIKFSPPETFKTDLSEACYYVDHTVQYIYRYKYCAYALHNFSIVLYKKLAIEDDLNRIQKQSDPHNMEQES